MESEDVKEVNEENNNKSSIYGIKYSEHSVAIFGPTKSIKDQLKTMGGKFNMYLRSRNGEKEPGWIFPKAKISEIENTLKIKIEMSICATSENKQTEKLSDEPKSSEDTNSKRTINEVGVTTSSVGPVNRTSNNTGGEEIEIVQYSSYSIAIFGNTKAWKDALKSKGGKYNAYLTHGSDKKPGWIFPLAKRAEIETLLGYSPASNDSTNANTNSIPDQPESKSEGQIIKRHRTDNDGDSDFVSDA